MSVTILADEWLVARKEHTCDACLGVIAAGDRYRRQRNVDDHVFTFKCHALCDAIWWHLYYEHGLFDDEALDPSDDIRPALQQFFDTLASSRRSNDD